MQESEKKFTEAEQDRPFNVLGWEIKQGQKSSVDHDRQIIITENKPRQVDEYGFKGILLAARETALTEIVRAQNTEQNFSFFSRSKMFIGDILRLTGARLLREQEPEIAKSLTDRLPKAKNLVSEFQNACAIFAATGHFPVTTEPVRQALDTLPTGKSGVHLLDSLASERVTIERKADYYERFLKPVYKRLKEEDEELTESTKDSFQPSTDDSPEKQEIEEQNVRQRVNPFLGGLYREKVYDGVNWDKMEVVASGVPSIKLVNDEEENPGAEENVYVFSGNNGDEFMSGEISLPLPAKVVVKPETVPEGMVIRRTTNGIYTAEWSGDSKPSQEYNFSFYKTDIPLDWQKAEPTDLEIGIPDRVIDTFSGETKEFLNNLKNSKITDTARVQQVARRVQREIEYVNDSSVQTKLRNAGTDYFRSLEQIKKGDCDVSGFYALAQIRALDIPCRMIVGYSVRKNKKFDFAAIAGTKHAWLEWYNKDAGLWEKIDPTPPKRNNEQDKDDNGGGGGGGGDVIAMNLTEDAAVSEPDDIDDDPWGIPFSDEDMAKLSKLVNSGVNSISTKPDATQIFTEMYGVAPERWNKTKQVAERIGRTKIPREATILGKYESTVSGQWKEIFDLLLIAYRLPDKDRAYIVRQSQGGELFDPAVAVVDIISGSEDPYGYRKIIKKDKLFKRPIFYSNDFLLDLTASMRATNSEGKSLLTLEREFVISSLFEGFLLNERLKQKESELDRRPIITDHVLSIHGGGKWQEIIRPSAITLKELTMIDDAMQKTTAGGGAMADALEAYLTTLKADTTVMQELRNGDILKTLTVVSDGNMWCSACGKESCSYQHDAGTIVRIKRAINEAREMGVAVNAIGFTDLSRPVTEFFKLPGDDSSAVIAETLPGALTAHHTQITRAMKPILDLGKK